MIDINELRRLAQAALAAPDGLSAEWMDRLGQFQEAADASVISELLDRLEAAEKDSAHQKALAASALRVAEGWERKCGELRAKIEAMEKQEPAATVRINAVNGNPSVDFVPGHRYLHHNDKLYLAPGAQPTPSIPEGWKLVPTAESRHPGIYKMLGALHAIDNTRGASEWESYAAMLAAAPEVKA